MSAQPEGPRGVLLFGGAFNPPHLTHRRILRTAMETLPVDRALVVPSGRHPLKGAADMAPDAARLELCALAFGDMAGVVVSDVELNREGVSYTVDTVRELRADFPGRRLFLLIGSDNLDILDAWHAHHELLELVTLVTFPRAGHPVRAAQLATQDLTEEERASLLNHVLDVPPDHVSATAIRASLRAGEPCEELSRVVADRIRSMGLYTE